MAQVQYETVALAQDTEELLTKQECLQYLEISLDITAENTNEIMKKSMGN